MPCKLAGAQSIQARVYALQACRTHTLACIRAHTLACIRVQTLLQGPNLKLLLAGESPNQCYAGMAEGGNRIPDQVSLWEKIIKMAEIKIELEEPREGNLELPLAPPALPAPAPPVLAQPVLALPAPAEAAETRAEAQMELWRQTMAEFSSSAHIEEIDSLKRRVAALEEEVAALEEVVANKDRIIAAIQQAKQGTLFSVEITPKKRRLMREISDLVSSQSVSSMTCSSTHLENEDPQTSGAQSMASSCSELVPLFPGGVPILTEIEKRNVYRTGTTKEALLVALLDAVFGAKILANGNACGARVAVNKGEGDHEALDPVKLYQIKECVLRRFEPQNGLGCFSPQEFNRKINQKCATARRALKNKKNVVT